MRFMYKFSAKAGDVHLCKTVLNAIYSDKLLKFNNNLYYYNEGGLGYADSSITFQVIECYRRGSFPICGVNLIDKDFLSLKDGSRIFRLDEMGIKVALKFTQEEILKCVVSGGELNFMDFNLRSIDILRRSSNEMEENLVGKFGLRLKI